MQRRHLTTRLAGCVAALLITTTVFPDVVEPRPRTLEQPNGIEFAVVARGDERANWYETEAGYTIDRAPNGYWYYVTKTPSGDVKRTRRLAHWPVDSATVAEPNLNPHQHISKTLPPWIYQEFDEADLRVGPHEGKVLVISVEFDDQASTYHESVWAERIASTDPEAKTIAHYYQAVSYGAATLSPAEETYGADDNGVIGPLALAMDHPDTGGENLGDVALDHDAVYQQAIDAADPFIDYASFDTNGDNVIEPDELAVVVVLAGYEFTRSSARPSVHGHASIFGNQPKLVADTGPAGGPVILVQRYAMLGEKSADLTVASTAIATTLGTFVHELGHLIYRLPDLYDLDGSSRGIGSFGLMGEGSRGVDYDNDQQVGETPVLLSAWSQFKLGWVSARSNHWSDTSLTTAGRSSLPSSDAQVVIAHAGAEDPVTGVVVCDDKEYFLVQYRTAEGYDRGFNPVKDHTTGDEFEGVTIFHVDERQVGNDNEARRLLDVEEATDPPLDAVEGTHFHLWSEADGQTVFDESSLPSDSTLQGGAASGVTITVGSPHIDGDGENAVTVTVDSWCDVSGASVIIP